MSEIITILKPIIRDLIRDGYTKKQIEYFTKNAIKEIFKELDKKLVLREIKHSEICDNEISFVEPPCDTEASYN